MPRYNKPRRSHQKEKFFVRPQERKKECSLKRTRPFARVSSCPYDFYFLKHFDGRFQGRRAFHQDVRGMKLEICAIPQSTRRRSFSHSLHPMSHLHFAQRTLNRLEKTKTDWFDQFALTKEEKEQFRFSRGQQRSDHLPQKRLLDRLLRLIL